jgi:hypothetical protein
MEMLMRHYASGDIDTTEYEGKLANLRRLQSHWARIQIREADLWIRFWAGYRSKVLIHSRRLETQ